MKLFYSNTSFLLMEKNVTGRGLGAWILELHYLPQPNILVFKVLLFFRILSENAFYQTIQTTSFFLTLVSHHHTHPFPSLPFGNSFLYYKLLTSGSVD